MNHTEREYQLEQHIFCLSFTLQQILLALNTGNQAMLHDNMKRASGYVIHWMDNLQTHYLQHPNWEATREGDWNPLWDADLSPKDETEAKRSMTQTDPRGAKCCLCGEYAYFAAYDPCPFSDDGQHKVSHESEAG